MKKFWVLFSLFILPLVFYIFLSKGIYHYANLPILTEDVLEISDPLNEERILEERLNVICFPGKEEAVAKSGLFNLNQTIYKRFYQKPFFQAIAIIPMESKAMYQPVIDQLSAFTDISKWKFIYISEKEISNFFNSLGTPFLLNEHYYSNRVFIVDKELRLRGRKDDEDTADGKLYGYNMESVAELKNKMKDDIEIIYYQWKKSAEKEARRKKDS